MRYPNKIVEAWPQQIPDFNKFPTSTNFYYTLFLKIKNTSKSTKDENLRS